MMSYSKNKIWLIGLLALTFAAFASVGLWGTANSGNSVFGGSETRQTVGADGGDTSADFDGMDSNPYFVDVTAKYPDCSGMVTAQGMTFDGGGSLITRNHNFQSLTGFRDAEVSFDYQCTTKGGYQFFLTLRSEKDNQAHYNATAPLFEVYVDGSGLTLMNVQNAATVEQQTIGFGAEGMPDLNDGKNYTIRIAIASDGFSVRIAVSEKTTVLCDVTKRFATAIAERGAYGFFPSPDAVFKMANFGTKIARDLDPDTAVSEDGRGEFLGNSFFVTTGDLTATHFEFSFLFDSSKNPMINLWLRSDASASSQSWAGPSRGVFIALDANTLYVSKSADSADGALDETAKASCSQFPIETANGKVTYLRAVIGGGDKDNVTIFVNGQYVTATVAKIPASGKAAAVGFTGGGQASLEEHFAFHAYSEAILPVSVRVDRESVNLFTVDEEETYTHQIAASVLPAEADQDLTFAVTQGSEIGSVTDGGLVTVVGKKKGEIVVRVASASRPAVFSEVTVVCTDEKKVESIAITDASGNPFADGRTTLRREETLALKLVYTPSDTTNREVVWSSSDPEKASVSASGLVKALSSSGTVTITAVCTQKSGDGSDISASVTIELAKLAPSSLLVSNGFFEQPEDYSALTEAQLEALDTLEIYLLKEDTLKLYPILIPLAAEERGIDWQVSDSETLGFDGETLTLTGLKKGSATVTAVSSVNPSATKSFVVYVREDAAPSSLVPVKDYMKYDFNLNSSANVTVGEDGERIFNGTRTVIHSVDPAEQHPGQIYIRFRAQMSPMQKDYAFAFVLTSDNATHGAGSNFNEAGSKSLTFAIYSGQYVLFYNNGEAGGFKNVQTNSTPSGSSLVDGAAHNLEFSFNYEDNILTLGIDGGPAIRYLLGDDMPLFERGGIQMIGSVPGVVYCFDVVNPLIQVPEISLEKTSLELTEGDEDLLKVLFGEAGDYALTDVVWSSSDPAKVSVTKRGKISALAATDGVTITVASVYDPERRAAATVKVNEKPVAPGPGPDDPADEAGCGCHSASGAAALSVLLLAVVCVKRFF